VILVFVVGLLSSLFLVVFGFQCLYWDRIYPGVSVLGLELGGLSVEEAAQVLQRAFTPYSGPPLILRYGQQTWHLTPSQLGVTLDAHTTAEAAYAVGRCLSWKENLLLQFGALWSGHQIPPVFSFNDGLAIMALSRIARQINRPVRDAKVTVQGLEVRASPSQTGREVDIPATLKRLYERIQNLRGGEVELVVRETPPAIADATETRALIERMLSSPLLLRPLPNSPSHSVSDLGPWTLKREDIAAMLLIHPVKESEGMRLVAELDEDKLRAYLQTLAADIERPPQDARFQFDPSTGQLTPIRQSVEGRSLDIAGAMEAIKQGVLGEKREVFLPIQVLPPRVTVEDAPRLGIKELVSEGKTSFKGSSAGRIKNIKVAASRFHGLVLLPEEVFSFNEHLGEVSAEAGYEESLIIWGDRTVADVGGGICQVSSTFFRAAFWAGFPILERWPHAYRVSWYEPPVGMDATIYAPLVDLKFKNDTPYPVLIQTEVDEKAGVLAVRFYGTRLPRTVEMEGPFIEDVVKPGPPIYQEDPSLPKGQIKQVEWAHDGAVVTIRRIVKEGDRVLYRDTFVSRYKPWRAVYKVGTGE